MFLYYYVHVAGTVAEVSRQLTDAPGQMSVWAQLAYEGGEELRTRVRPGPWAPAKEIELIVNKPVWRGRAGYIPITWRASGTEVLFPKLEADLVLEEIADEVTQISLRGSYQPPLGGLGRLLDRAILHHLAEACVKNFLESIAAAFPVSVTEAPHGHP